MNKKTETNPKGSGIGKSVERVKLEGIDLIKMLSNHDINYLVIKYDVSKQVFLQVLTEQFKKRDVGLKPDKINLSRVPSLVKKVKYKGAWMGSDMRRFMFENKLLEAQQELKS